MIPKIIHYCWFGGKPLTPLAKKCIESWRKYCPDYKIVEWNEKNFDLSYCTYVKEAYKAKKWAFVTDVVRLYALVNFGGVYMDTDVEVVKPIDNILSYKAVSGFQTKTEIQTGLMAAEKGHKLFVELLNDYADIHFIMPDGKINYTTNVERIMKVCSKYGFVPDNKLQTIADFTIFPMDYFCAKDIVSGKIKITHNTYTIHHFAGSWTTPRNKINTKIFRLLQKIFGDSIAQKVQLKCKKK